MGYATSRADIGYKLDGLEKMLKFAESQPIYIVFLFVVLARLLVDGAAFTCSLLRGFPYGVSHTSKHKLRETKK